MLSICANGFGRGAAIESATVPEPQPEAGTEAATDKGEGAHDRNPSRRPLEREFDRVRWPEQNGCAGILFHSFQFHVTFTCLCKF